MRTWSILEMCAREKLGLTAEWELCGAEVLPHNAQPGVPVVYEAVLGVPRILTRGPNKGHKCWDGPTHYMWCGSAELDIRAAQYEAWTGNCCECMGDGKRLIRAGVHGTEYGDCRQCHGSGKAKAA